MRNCLSRTVLFAAPFVLIAATSDAQQSVPPVDAFAQLPEFDQPSLSPDGKHFAVIQSIQGRPAAVIYAVGAPPGTRPAVIPSAEDLVAGIQWAKNDRLLVTVKKNTTMRWTDDPKLVRSLTRFFSTNVDGSDARMLMEHDPFMNINVRDSIDDIDLDDPDHVYMSFYTEGLTIVPNEEEVRRARSGQNQSTAHLNLVRVNVRTGEGETVMDGNPNTRGWILNGHGQLVARIDETIDPLRDNVKYYDNGIWKNLASYDVSGDRDASLVGLSEDGKAILRIAGREGGTKVLSRVDFASGDSSVYYANPDYDVGDLIGDEWSNAIIGAGYISDTPQFHFFDDKAEALQRGLEQSFPGLTVHAVSSDLERTHVIVETEGPRSPPTYYYLDRTTHQASKIGSAYPRLAPADLGEMKPYPYKARDGLDIPAYITLPPGREARNLPAIVMPHGGPDSRDYIAFDWWAQFLANRGYVVLQPNYRGSEGYGAKFTEAGLHQWGLKMQDDISDGVKKMIADGIADPKRVCIVGASYGGYAALAGATLTPDLYACAFSFAGISDLPQLLVYEAHTEGKESGAVSFWASRIGTIAGDDRQLDATSPDLHADRAKCPILLMHGEGDTTVPIEQSELMAAALQKAGKNVRFIRVAGEDHYMNLADTRAQMLTELEAFLAANIGSGAH